MGNITAIKGDGMFAALVHDSYGYLVPVDRPQYHYPCEWCGAASGEPCKED